MKYKTVCAENNKPSDIRNLTITELLRGVFWYFRYNSVQGVSPTFALLRAAWPALKAWKRGIKKDVYLGHPDIYL